MKIELPDAEGETTILTASDLTLDCGDSESCAYDVFAGVVDAAAANGRDTLPPLTAIVLVCHVHRTPFLITGDNLRMRQTEVRYLVTKGESV